MKIINTPKMAHKLATLFFMITLGHHNLVAQSYLGLGWHLGMPMKVDNCCVPHLRLKPIPASAYSLTYKNKFGIKGKWYLEAGLTSMGQSFDEIEYDNDTIGIIPWGIFRWRQQELFSVLLGLGRNLQLKNKHEFVLGIEGSLRVGYKSGGIGSSTFALLYDRQDVPSPFFLRANIGYSIPFKLFKQIPSHFLIYSKLSYQNIAKGPQQITDITTGVTKMDGEYALNNSEAGIQFYIDLGKQHYNFLDRAPKERKPRIKRTGKSKIKFSVETQYFLERPTQYFMPQVDSFSLSGIISPPTSQIGLKAEFVHFKNTNWSTVVAIGTGIMNESRRFSAFTAYIPNGVEIKPTAAGSPLGRYLIENIGLSYQQQLKKNKLKHTLTVCAIHPIEKYNADYSLFTAGNLGNPILKGNINHIYSHHKVAFGLEYNPEFLFHTHKRLYFGLGLVFNYSWGVLAQGRATVTNGRTTYYGGMVQRFSKIGITASMGFQGRRSVMDNLN